MNKIIKRLLIIIILISLFIIAYYIGNRNKTSTNIDEIITNQSSTVPDSSSTIISVKKEMPYIENGYLYTSIRTVAIKDITRIDLDNTSISYYLISWEENKYHGGAFTMSYHDFKKIEKELLGK